MYYEHVKFKSFQFSLEMADLRFFGTEKGLLELTKYLKTKDRRKLKLQQNLARNVSHLALIL